MTQHTQLELTLSEAHETQGSVGDSYIYRTQRVAIEEHPLGGWDLRTCKRTTRVVARYTHVLVKERVRDRAPDRSDNPTLCRTAEPGSEPRRFGDNDVPSRKPPSKFHTRYTEEQVRAKKTRGYYHAIEVFRATKTPKLMVRAVCRGGWCPGKERVFATHQWMFADDNADMGCSTCRRKYVLEQERLAKLAAGHIGNKRLWNPDTILQTFGAYRFVQIVQTESGAVKVRAQCTGDVCGGEMRDFQVSTWQNRSTQHQGYGCAVCAGAKRKELRARAALEKAGAMLPGPMVARDMEMVG